eukprot:12937693-Prorocentrum_lima.AAC.1
MFAYWQGDSVLHASLAEPLQEDTAQLTDPWLEKPLLGAVLPGEGKNTHGARRFGSTCFFY